MTEVVDSRAPRADAAGRPRTAQSDRQERAAFYLGGRRGDAGLPSVAGCGLRPALMARHRHLTEVRHDYPLILVDRTDTATPVLSLSGLFDELLSTAATGDAADRIRQHGLRLERAIRERAVQGSNKRLSQLWTEAERALAEVGDASLADSLARLGSARHIDGVVIACDRQTPRHFLEHLWHRVQRQRVQRLRARIDRLALSLAEILQAEESNSPAGVAADRLRTSFGTAFAGELDFDALARLLTKVQSKGSLSDARRERVRRLLSILESQRFCSTRERLGRSEAVSAYEFVFQACSTPIDAYRERFAAMAELAKAMVMAELEVDGRYREDTHDALFAAWNVSDADSEAFAQFPEYLACVDAEKMSAQDSVKLLEALSSGLPLKVLVQANELSGPSPVHDGNPGAGLSANLLASAVLSAGNAFVLQATSADLYRACDRVQRGLEQRGPALFVVYSGAGGVGSYDLPAYLVAAAALESRAFPAFTYDPGAGMTWADRFSLKGNPQPERDWPVRKLTYEDEALQRVDVDVAFTIVDFLACDARYSGHVALSEGDPAAGTVVPAAERIAAASEGQPEELPYVLMVDPQDTLRRVLVDGRLIRLARRGLDRWRSLQELGGIHNSHAERQVALQRKAWEVERAQLEAQRKTDPVAPAPAPTVQEAALAAATPAAPAPTPAFDPDVARIETLRCSTCNECTRINDRMFKYNENKQAYIADPDAGTYAQMVQAAESCQVAIIHPGKPRNPAEPGLDRLLERAAKFM